MNTPPMQSGEHHALGMPFYIDIINYNPLNLYRKELSCSFILPPSLPLHASSIKMKVTFKFGPPLYCCSNPLNSFEVLKQTNPRALLYKCNHDKNQYK